MSPPKISGQRSCSALNDPQVKAICFYIDSPGGTVDGTQELANLIYENRGSKPIIGYSDGMVCSAAYWIFSAMDQRFISGDTVQVGSIGVVSTHVDISKLEDQIGIKTTEITAGKFKRIASMHSPLSDDGRATIQDQVDHLYSVFVGDVARNLGVGVDQVLADMADGKTFFGKQAIAAGMVDGVSTMDRLINTPGGGPGRDNVTAVEVIKNWKALPVEIKKSLSVSDFEKLFTLQKSGNPEAKTALDHWMMAGESFWSAWGSPLKYFEYLKTKKKKG